MKNIKLHIMKGIFRVNSGILHERFKEIHSGIKKLNQLKLDEHITNLNRINEIKISPKSQARMSSSIRGF